MHHRFLARACALAVLFLAQPVPSIALAAADTPRHREEIVTSSHHEYRLRLEGTVDAENTRDPIVYSAWQQGFQPMRSVRIANIGESDVINPWVIVNGKRDWRSLHSIVAEALRAYGDPATLTEASKARLLWEFVARHRFHATTVDFAVRDPVRMFNVFGYVLCGDNASVLMDLWRAAGLRTRRGFPMGHCVAEVWYDGGWHLFDGDLSVFYLDRDNETVLGEKSVVHDHDLIKRAHADEYTPALYNFEGTHTGEFASHPDSRMTLTLRPGEALEWRWSHVGKHYYAREPVLYAMQTPRMLSNWGPTAWATLANGKWTYAPPLRSGRMPQGVSAENIRWSTDPNAPAASVANAGTPATLTWKIETPYAIVGGKIAADVRCAGTARCGWQVSLDALTWRTVEPAPAGDGRVSIDLDPFFADAPAVVYRYFVRAGLHAPTAADRAGLDRIAIDNDLQMAVLSLPALERGDNVIVYRDETKAPHRVRIDFDYVERSSMVPPAPPRAPIHPVDGNEIEGTALTFRWQPATAEAGEKIVDYHFQLGADAALRWSLAPSFEGQTKGLTEFIVGQPGRLTPGRRYYWRVRARSAQGVWGPWSATWSFVPQGPRLPTNVRFEARDPERLTLAWDLAREGRPPVAFRIYASDEKGFSVSDVPYEVAVGNQKEKGLFPGRKTATFRANYLLSTTETAIAFRPARAFYRVVAVDENGNRSGSSAYAAAPRPFIHTDPPRIVKVGAAFLYEPKSVASIGDLTYRDFGIGAHYQAAFWDSDQPRYSFEPEYPRCGNRTAEWLALDPVTGRITGTPGPADVGEWQINLKVETPGVGAHVQSFPVDVIP